MAEDITDLTEDEESQSGDKGKQKPEKAKKEKKEKKEKEPKSPALVDEKTGKKDKSGKKKGGKLKIILIIILVIILILAAAAAALYFDLFQARELVRDFAYEPLIAVVVWLDPEFTSVEKDLKEASDARERELDSRENALDAREQEIATREAEVTDRENQLNRRTIALDRREEQLNILYDSSIPVFRREMNEQQREDMVSLSRTYSQMSPESAAEILSELAEPMDVAAILFFMAERSAAAILAAMDPVYSAEITEILLVN